MDLDGEISDDASANAANSNPNPLHFAEFLPWACKQLLLDFRIIITNVTLRKSFLYNSFWYTS